MSDPVVTIKQGDLRGVKVENVVGGSYISFKGIPYAIPPVGDLRFRDPLPAQPWTGVRDAITEGSKAAQSDALIQEIVGDDDCLYLNVATTDLTGSRPVMVWIHGGGFIGGDGSSDIYGPDYLMDSGVVFVGINYRLGVLGFLHLDHEVAPGNMGLKDQVAALKWVRDNIAQFGGDPNNVTIFGESAGGASVHYLLLSPLAKERIRVEPLRLRSQTVNMGCRFVSALGRDITDPNEIVEYLRTIPIQRLIEVQREISTPGSSIACVQERINYLFPFGPSVDDKCPEPCVPKPVPELVTERVDLPIIIGYNIHEGLFFTSRASFPVEFQKQAVLMLDKNFEMAVPRDLSAKAASKVSEIGRDITKFYFGDKHINDKVFEEFVQWFGDLHFGQGIHRVVNIQRENESPTYFYRFSYNNPNSIAKSLFQVKTKGAMDCEELYYLFFSNMIPEEMRIKLSTTEQLVRDKFVRMWTDFAKTGNPTPSIDDLITAKWEPVTKSTKHFLNIDAEFSASVIPNNDMFEVWRRVYAIADD